MTPSIDRSSVPRKRMVENCGSPPPTKIVTEEQILQRGCPGAPRKSESSTSRKRLRQRSPNIFLAMNMMGEEDNEEDDGRDEPIRMQPRHMFPPSPTYVQDVPRPTPRRALPPRGHLPSHNLQGHIIPTASGMRE